MAQPLTFTFDFISPYAYLGWTQIHRVAAAHGRWVQPVPVLFAGLLNHWGQLGPAEIAPKRAYVFRDVLRTAVVLGLRVRPPPAHPFNPLLALRVCCVDMDASTRRRLIDLLFAATWVEGSGVDHEEGVAAALSAAGLDSQTVLAQARQPAAKGRLRANTEGAIAAGVFGVPTVVADGEMFWGYDSFGHLDRFLGGERSVDDRALARWAELPAAAQRRPPTGSGS